MNEREIIITAPELPSDLHAEVRAEVADAWGKGRPWTQIRALRKGIDNPSVPCVGAQGEFLKDGECKNKVEGIQYNIQGVQMCYCEEHALKQNEWDKVFYDSKGTPPRPKWTAADEEFVKKLREGKKRRKKNEELEEIDPAA